MSRDTTTLLSLSNFINLLNMNKSDMFQNKTLISDIIYKNTMGSHVVIYDFP